MSRTITSILIDLAFSNAPALAVAFTDRAEDGHESQGSTRIEDAAAREIVTAKLLEDVVAALAVKDAAVSEPGAIAERMAAASAAETRMRAAVAREEEANRAKLEADAQALSALAQFEATQASKAALDLEVARLDAEIATKREEVKL